MMDKDELEEIYRRLAYERRKIDLAAAAWLNASIEQIVVSALKALSEQKGQSKDD